MNVPAASTMPDAYAELLRRYAELRDLASAAALLSWDQETMMPRKGAAARARQLATLAGMRHERFTDPHIGELLQRCESANGALGELERAQIRELRYDWDRATRIPRELVEALAAAESAALEAWRDARAKSSWRDFAPHLQKLLALLREKVGALGFADRPYDGLLDEFERGATEAALDELFRDLRAKLAPLVAAVLDRRERVDATCARKELDEERQGKFGLLVIKQMGFDLEAGRVDLSSHPFCTGIALGDCRLTRRLIKGDLRPALYGIIHEAGHGLYEQGLPDALDRTPLGEACSLGVHESQSRLWENVIGRSRPFWNHFFPELQRAFPNDFRGVTAEQMWRAVNQVEASLIRVEADELTYNLHVLLRFELERALVGGDLEVADVPSAWNAKMSELLDITPKNDAEGCLQDIHWSMGALGYFPTYTLGNLYAAQLFGAARRALPELDAQIERGEMLPLREWLRENVHRHGRRWLPAELVEKATGRKPTAEPFLQYLREKVAAVYGV
jgi:carboxypeptidase Taq